MTHMTTRVPAQLNLWTCHTQPPGSLCLVGTFIAGLGSGLQLVFNTILTICA